MDSSGTEYLRRNRMNEEKSKDRLVVGELQNLGEAKGKGRREKTR